MTTNKEIFIKTLSAVKRQGIPEFIKWLEGTSFFEAPASLKLYRNYEGGLCEQALIRCNILNNIIKYNAYSIDSDSATLAALLANVDKADYFKKVAKNKKVYTINGSKRDELGTFDWKTEVGFDIKNAEERFVFGTSGQNAKRMITGFIPLTDEESAAIINMGVTHENPTFYFADIYKRYPLACLLNAADSIATFMTQEEIPF